MYKKASSILIYKDRGSTDMNPGYLVAFNGSSYSYVCSPGSLMVREEENIATVQMKNPFGKVLVGRNKIDHFY